MHLTRHTDYALRVMLYLAVQPNRRVTIAEIAERFAIPRQHLMKTVNELSRMGYVEAVRGKGGGISLGRDPSTVSLDALVRDLEPDKPLVDCFDPRCPAAGVCRLVGALGRARDAFFDALGDYSLADMVENREQLIGKLVRPDQAAGDRPPG